jgi:hypothetical protein
MDALPLPNVCIVGTTTWTTCAGRRSSSGSMGR